GRTRAHLRSGDAHARWIRAGFDPVHHRRNKVHGVWPHSSLAVADSWVQEHPNVLVRSGLPTRGLHETLIVSVQVLGADPCIREALIEDQLALSGPERAQVRTVAVGQFAQLLNSR